MELILQSWYEREGERRLDNEREYFLIFDATNYIHRGYHSTPLSVNSKGQYVNAIYGFFHYVRGYLDGFRPTYAAFCLDMPRDTFRHKLYPLYKQNRKHPPRPKPGLRDQFYPIMQILKLGGFRWVQKRGYEADDLIGTLSTVASKDLHVVIVSGDRDMLQLVNEYVSVYWTHPKENILYTPSKVKEVYGVTPKQLIEIKGLMGDKGDNIPGVNGIGPSKAKDLIQTFGDIDTLYSLLEESDIEDGIKKLLLKEKNMCYLSRKLGEIVRDVQDIDMDIETYRIQKPRKKIVEYLEEFELIELLYVLNKKLYFKAKNMYVGDL
jgi:DNA polymerase-1